MPAEVLRDETSGAAAARMAEFLFIVEGMFAETVRRPLEVFQQAGVQPKAVGRVTRAALCEEAPARLAIACALRAGLFDRDGTLLHLSPEGRAFTFLPPGDQAARMLAAWWHLPYAPTRTHTGEGNRLYVGGKETCDGCVKLRHSLADVLPEASDGQGGRSAAGVARELDRLLTCAHGRDTPRHGVLLGEAGALGVVEGGALSPFGALLAAGDHEELAAAAARSLPPFTERAAISPGFTVTVQGTPSRRLAKALDTVADRGLGPVWKIGGASLQRAAASGLGARDIETGLAAISTTPLPTGLRELIRRTAEGHDPRPREVPASCVFHSTDPGLVARAVRDPALQALGARLLAPGVLIATGPRDAVLAALRAAGHTPVEDPPPALLRPPVRRPPVLEPPAAPAAPRPARSGPARSGPARSGPARSRPSRRRSPLEKAEALFTREARELTAAEITLIARAVTDATRIRIGYVDLKGVATERVLAPPYEHVKQGRSKLLQAICETRSAEQGHPVERHFHYARILSVHTP